MFYYCLQIENGEMSIKSSIMEGIKLEAHGYTIIVGSIHKTISFKYGFLII